MDCLFEHQDLEMFDPKLELVGRGSETQLQGGENLNRTT